MEEYRACALSAQNVKIDVMLINLKCEKNYNLLLYYTLYCVLLAVRLSIFICSAMMDDSDSQSPLPSSCRRDHLGAPNKRLWSPKLTRGVPRSQRSITEPNYSVDVMKSGRGHVSSMATATRDNSKLSPGNPNFEEFAPSPAAEFTHAKSLPLSIRAQTCYTGCIVEEDSDNQRSDIVCGVYQ